MGKGAREQGEMEITLDLEELHTAMALSDSTVSLGRCAGNFVIFLKHPFPIKR